jgi:raffinose synthase
MYKINQREELIDILWDGKAIIKGIRPRISLEGNAPYNPEYKRTETSSCEDTSREYTEYGIFYGDEEKVEVKITLKCYKDFLITTVDVFQKLDVFRNTSPLLPVGGIKLQLEGVGEAEGVMVNSMYCNWWTRPYFAKEVSSIPPRSNSMLWKDETNFHHMLPFCDDIFKTEFQGNGSGMDIVISSYTQGYKNCKTASFILGSGKNPFEVSKRITEAGFKALNTSGIMREKRRYPEVFNYIGWCSWDAFYHEVNSKGVLAKAEEFKSLGLPLGWIMIDDGWSELKDRKLLSFKEDREKFPEGLKGCIDILKTEYGVNWVGVWHAYTGYWNGVHPESELAKELKEYLITANSGMILPAPDASKGFGFWNTWYRYLKKQGVDFVKVDNQSSMLDYYKDNTSVGKAARETHEALEASVGINFDNIIINCMGLGLEDIWSRPISAVSRNSDDFYPRKENNFKDHALQNAYNSFYHRNFMWGDWDMWWTIHEQDVNNAVLRAVSGGPVYVSDGVGKTDPSKLWPLILRDGKILRCDQPGLPTEDCLVHSPREERIPLKVWNRYRDTGVIAVFNINANGDTVEGTISPSDIPGIEGEKFVVYSHFKKEAIVSSRDEKLTFKLSDNEVDLYVIIPVIGGITPLGLLNKYISPAAVEDIQVQKNKTLVVLKEGGLFGFAADKKPSGVLVNGVEVAIAEKAGVYIVDCSDCVERAYIEIY